MTIKEIIIILAGVSFLVIIFVLRSMLYAFWDNKIRRMKIVDFERIEFPFSKIVLILYFSIFFSPGIFMFIC